MERFPVHTLDTAPEASKSALRDVQARFGMIPNLAGAMATSPVLIQAFIQIFDKVHGGSFTEPQIQAVLLTDAVTNVSPWAVALHTALALQAGLDPADVEAMRAGRSPSDAKLGALSTVARTQFLASQIAMLASFLPGLFFSGFIFELASMPTPLRAFSTLISARYFVTSLQTIFLAGDIAAVLVPNILILTFMSVAVLFLTARNSKMRLD